MELKVFWVSKVCLLGLILYSDIGFSMTETTRPSPDQWHFRGSWGDSSAIWMCRAMSHSSPDSQLPQRHHQCGDDLESPGFLNTKTNHCWVPRTVSGTSRYVFLGMDHFQGWNMKKSNFPHSIFFSRCSAFHLDAKRVRILCRIISGTQVRPPWREEGHNYQAGVWRWKAIHAKNLATNASRPWRRCCKDNYLSPEWASLICSHGMWLQPPVTVPLQIRLKRIHLASPRWEIGRNACSPDILASSSYINGPEKTEPSKQIFIFFQRTAHFILEQKLTKLYK